jgi:hypothetical protein
MPRPRFRAAPTPAGYAVIAAVLLIFIRSLIARNAYEIALSSAVLLVWHTLFFTGLWNVRRFSLLDPDWKPPSPLTADTGVETLVTGLNAAAPVFFRFHFIVSGRFFPQGAGHGCPFRAGTSVPRQGGAARLPVNFPMGGLLHGEGQCFLRDIFGFFSFRCGLSRRHLLRVRSSPCGDTNFRLNPQSGAEDRRNKTSSDEERYYMREYAPGDRFRDINWKSSERIDTLITRISPDNQEKVSRIEVYFRNFGPAGGGASLGDLWLLDRAKARLAWFLRRVMGEEAARVFHIRAASGGWEIHDTDELEAFLEELAGLTFAPDRNGELGEAPLSGEMYVFSTACDAGLAGFISANGQGLLSLFIAQSPPPKTRRGEPVGPGREKRVDEDAALLHLRDFPAKGFLPPPRWLRPGSVRRLPPLNRAGLAALRIDYAEALL